MEITEQFSEFDLPRKYNKDNFYKSKRTKTEYLPTTSEGHIEFDGEVLSTTKLLEIVELMDNASNARQVMSIKEKYGRDILVFIWVEYLSESLKSRIRSFFDF